MSNYNEPWYQTQTMSYQEVYKSLKTCMKYKIYNDKLLDNIIKEILPKNIDFGSHRGYYTFLHTEYKNKIMERFNYLNYKKPDK